MHSTTQHRVSTVAIPALEVGKSGVEPPKIIVLSPQRRLSRIAVLVAWPINTRMFHINSRANAGCVFLVKTAADELLNNVPNGTI